MNGRLLDDAIKQVDDGRGVGIVCPCCSQFVKEYKRKLNSTMARGLIWLVAEYIQKQDWVHVNNNAPRWLIKGGDFAKLLHWGLVIRKNNDNPKKSSSGFYMPTTNGMSFARSEIDVSAYAYIYNGKVRGFDPEQTCIIEALGNHFDYDELIKEHNLYSYNKQDENFVANETVLPAI